jgi:hypothetical protein
MLLLAVAFDSAGTHVRGGQIHVRQTLPGSKTCTITLEIYIDSESGVPVGGQGDALYFGDSDTPLLIPEILQGIPGATWTMVDPFMKVVRVTYTIVHTYPSFGTYKVRYQELNRNGGIINFDGSAGTPFYIESGFTISSTGQYESPTNLTKPIFLAWANTDFSFSLAADDPNDNMLYYKLVVPQSEPEKNVLNYKFPENLAVNPFSGLLTWDGKFNGMPLVGEYAVAIAIYQIRDNAIVGYSVRDFQVILADVEKKLTMSDNVDLNENNRIHTPVNTTFRLKVFAEEENAGDIKLEVFSKLTNFPGALTFETYDSINDTKKIKAGVLTINATEDILRDNPYPVIVRAVSNKNQLKKEKDLSYLFYSRDLEETLPEIVTDVAENESNLSVYPNPVDDFLVLEGFAKPGTHLELLSVVGANIAAQIENGMLDLRHLTPGIYYLRVTGNESKIIRIVKR